MVSVDKNQNINRGINVKIIHQTVARRKVKSMIKISKKLASGLPVLYQFIMSTIFRLEDLQKELYRLNIENQVLREKRGKSKTGEIVKLEYKFPEVSLTPQETILLSIDAILPIASHLTSAEKAIRTYIKRRFENGNCSVIVELLRSIENQGFVTDYRLRKFRGIGKRSAGLIMMSLVHFQLVDKHGKLLIQIPPRPQE